MKICLEPNFFALKCFDRDNKFGEVNAHMIFISYKCNFRCHFCGTDENTKKTLKNIRDQDYGIEKIKSKIDEMFLKGNIFKFTGGEPLLNAKIKEIMKYVKKRGGIIFLDTNSSMTNKLSELISNNLVDVLGVSLKGLDEESACKHSGISNKNLCWNNVLNSIDIALNSDTVSRIIITNVLYNFFDLEELYKELCKFVELFSKYREKDKLYSKLYFKFNNLFPSKLYSNLHPVDKNMLKNGIERLIENKQYLKNKLILINSEDCVSDYSKIVFF